MSLYFIKSRKYLFVNKVNIFIVALLRCSIIVYSMCIQNKDNLVQYSYERIRDMIFTYEIVPGHTISDYSLSSKLNISRTPIRQALMMLLSDGLVVKTNSSFSVVKIDRAFLDSLYEARLCLEPYIIKHNENIDLEKAEELIKKEENYIKEQNYVNALDIDLEFHNLLFTTYDNSILSASYKSIYSRMKLANVISLASVNKKAADEYKQIISSLKVGDKEKASKLLTKSISKGYIQKIKALEKYGALIFEMIRGYYENSDK